MSTPPRPQRVAQLDPGWSQHWAAVRAQDALTAAVPSRATLRSVVSGEARHTVVRVMFHRNLPVELVIRSWTPFAASAGLDLRGAAGTYDDSLSPRSGPEEGGTTDVHVVFIDPSRYHSSVRPDELAGWLADRARDLCARTGVPVLVVNWAAEDSDAGAYNDVLEERLAANPGVELADLRDVRRRLPAAWHDERMSAATGGAGWSDAAVLATARALATRWIPAVVGDLVKCVVLDLDHTLYDGVLGEDGPRGVALTAGHRELQQDLVRLAEAGVLLAVVSHNEASDVESLFETRADFPLRWEHFSCVLASWAPKGDSLAQVADHLRLSRDALALLDDNVGQLAHVSTVSPGTRLLHAVDPQTSRAALHYCPGLFRYRTSHTDRVRAADLTARAGHGHPPLGLAEDGLRQHLEDLHTRLNVAVDDPESFDRASELTRKTTQFNLSLQRCTTAELVRNVGLGGLRVVTVGLQDRLSDSGIVAAVMGRLAGHTLLIQGVYISCRALGREVETVILEHSFLLLSDSATETIALRFSRGPRNSPARDWLARYSGNPLEEGCGTRSVRWYPRTVRERLDSAPVTINGRTFS